jgi:phosphate transport system substrate-binding protein
MSYNDRLRSVDQSVKGIVLYGIVPSLDNAMNGSYPVVHKRSMNTEGEPPKLVKAFIEYITSPDGAVIIAKSEYLPLK